MMEKQKEGRRRLSRKWSLQSPSALAKDLNGSLTPSEIFVDITTAYRNHFRLSLPHVFRLIHFFIYLIFIFFFIFALIMPGKIRVRLV